MRFVARILQSKEDVVEQKIYETDSEGLPTRYIAGKETPQLNIKRIVGSAIVQFDDNRDGLQETIKALETILTDLKNQKLAS
jgi:hypothetical protein